MLVIRDSLSVVVCLCTVVLLLLAGSGRAAAGDSDEGWVFVSNVTGNDTTGDGTRAKPFETVTKALTVGPQVRLLPNAPSTPYPKITLTAGMADAEYKFVAEEGPQVTQLEAFESQGKRFLLLGLTLNNPFGTGITATNNVMADIRNCVAAYCAGDGVAIAGGIVNITNCVLYSNVYGLTAQIEHR